MIVPSINNFFISGSFRESGNDLAIIRDALQSAGFNAIVKTPKIQKPTNRLIEEADCFIPVIGMSEGVIKTPSGETLPEMELNHAIQERIPVISFLKNPLETASSPKQNRFRKLIRKRLNEAVIEYDTSSELIKKCERLTASDMEVIATPIKPLKVFISHTSADKPKVERIVQRLARASIETFYDQHDIGVGMSLKKTIRRAISSVGYVLVCLSPVAIESEWVRDEIRWALEHANRLGIDEDDFILPVRLKPFQLTEELSFLKDRKYADIASDFEAGLQNIIAAIMR